MGLDIYTHRTQDMAKYKEVIRQIEELEKISEDEWENNPLTAGKKYEEITDADKDTVSNLAHEKQRTRAKELDVTYTTWGDTKYNEWINPHDEEFEETSKVHPEHALFKLGYFRSSYNPSGINHILEDRIGISLYDIFDYSNDEEVDPFIPDWAEVKRKAIKARKDLKKAYDSTGSVAISEFTYNEFSGSPSDYDVKSEADALKIYQDTLEAHKDDEEPSSFSNGKGSFFFDSPMQVKAIITGVRKRFFVDESLPSQFVIYEQSDDTANFYLEALDIIAETADVALVDKNNIYFLSWSA